MLNTQFWLKSGHNLQCISIIWTSMYSACLSHIHYARTGNTRWNICLVSICRCKYKKLQTAAASAFHFIFAEKQLLPQGAVAKPKFKIVLQVQGWGSYTEFVDIFIINWSFVYLNLQHDVKKRDMVPEFAFDYNFYCSFGNKWSCSPHMLKFIGSECTEI